MIEFRLNGKVARSAGGCTLAAAIANQGVAAVRRSVKGDPRGPLCGMGICFECAVNLGVSLSSGDAQVVRKRSEFGLN